LRKLGLLGVALLRAHALAADPETLPGTAPLTLSGDLSKQMHEAADREMDRRMAAAQGQRAQYWHRDLSGSLVGYEKSVAENRERLKVIIGVVDERPPVRMERFGGELDPAELKGGLGDPLNPALVAETDTHHVFQVRWTVLEGVTGEGLLLEPKQPTRGYIIALPDADQTPEQIAGLARGVDQELRFARNLASLGFTVIVPTLIDRSTAGSGNPEITMTNQPQREWLHRQAYMMGRHIIGYEVQKVLAAIDWIERRGGQAARHIGVVGYGEGGLIALYSAAVDPRNSIACVSGYFRSREQTWNEPLSRNVWGLLREFGDAEIASLVAPRTLMAEYSREPEINGPPPVAARQKKCAAPGALTTATAADVKGEWARIETLIPDTLQARILDAEDQPVEPFHTPDMVRAFAGLVDEQTVPLKPGEGFPLRPLEVDLRRGFDPAVRQLRQVREIEAHVQHLVQVSEHTRDEFFLHKVAPEYRNEKWTYAHFEAKPPDAFIAGA
jgi:dienelactone hydrolase